MGNYHKYSCHEGGVVLFFGLNLVCLRSAFSLGCVVAFLFVLFVASTIILHHDRVKYLYSNIG